MGSPRSMQESTTNTTTYSNSFNKSYSLANVGNVAFGDAALQALVAGTDNYSQLVKWALIGTAVVVVASLVLGSGRK